MKPGLLKELCFSYYHVLCNLYEIFDELKGLYMIGDYINCNIKITALFQLTEFYQEKVNLQVEWIPPMT